MVENEYMPKPGDIVWIKPLKNGEFQLPWAAKIIKKSHSKLKVSNDAGHVFEIDCVAVIKTLHPSDIEPVNDMINLSDLSEQSILRNIQLRYSQNLIYTYTGGILVAVNPYKHLNIYSEEIICKYQGKRLFEQNPHIFAIGAQALENLKRHLNNQCIVISGETGSGKTEGTKFLLNFLAASSSKTSIGNKIVQANPILEEFGNAKTTQNDNSSRFGKYIEIFFRKDGTMKCASMQHYLLEKARVKSQNLGERNYHIFYSLLAGLPLHLKAQLKLTTPKDYLYLRQGLTYFCEGRDENEEFLKLKNAFSTLHFTEKEIYSIFQLLAAILHIGNFIFKITKDNEESIEIVHNLHLKCAINLLAVEEEHFIQALTQKMLLVEGTKVISSLNTEQAARSKDAFAMSLYNHLFSFILTTINKSISNHKVSRSPSIGILDIFGFENFASNSFEQLCINYANEHLQQYFVSHVFKLEQQEYINENIQWDCLSYEDNEKVLQLLGLNRMSILNILDEQTKFPKGSDEAFLLKCNQLHSEHIRYLKQKSEVSLMFGIKHYAGPVLYSVDGFIEKNVNILCLEWREVIRESGSQFLKDLYIKELNTAKGRPLTLVGQYKQSLDSLMTTLGKGTPFFIRCIKPNNTQQSNVFNNELVCQQLRYAGMMETARIRQTGYPIRYSHAEFVLRYRILVPGSFTINKRADMKEIAKKICEKYLDKEEYQFGKTKIFLKIPDEKLETIRDHIFSASAIILQKNFKATFTRHRFLKMRKAAIVIQRYWRGFKPRSNYRMVHCGYLRLQAILRSRQLKYDYNKMRSSIIRLQAMCRGVLVRRKLLTMKTMKKKPKIPPKPIPKPRKNSMPEKWIDDYITNVFDNAIEEKLENRSNENSYLKASTNADNVIEILEKPGVLSFQKFAASHFMGNVNCKFSNKLLDQPLLEMVSPGDVMAATVIWVTILRFMGDLEEDAILKKPLPKTRKTIMSQLQATVSKSFLHSKEYMNILNACRMEEQKIAHDNSEGKRKNLINLTLIHKNKLQNEVKRAQLELEDLKNSYEEWAVATPTTLLEKLHFIIGHGILRPTLRDEIYCQICKQLTDNSDPTSNMYGWILITLCASSFPPSLKLAPTLLHFLAKGGNMLGCVTRLQRTLQNGARTQPPTAFELSALKHQEKMHVDILLLDDSSVALDVDHATTAEEICNNVCSKINLVDSFGFSVFVSMFGQTISLESGNWFLMDGISQCESKANDEGLPEIEAPWMVVFRREIFPPWSVSISDSVSVNLTYIQIIKGLVIGDYKCSQQCELALLVAQHYYVSCGKRLLPEILDSLIKEVVPEPLFKQKDINWTKAVSDAFHRSYFIKRKILEEDVKIDVVNFAKKKWPLLFSRCYEVTQIAGNYLGTSEILLAVNADGLLFVKNSLEIMMKITYVEIDSFEHLAGNSKDKDQIHISTIHQHHYVFVSQYTEIISTFVNNILDELMLKSKYAVAINDYLPPDDSFLKLHVGDLIMLSEHGSDGKWMRGSHLDSGHIGEFPRRIVKILPCVEKPPFNIMASYPEEVKINKYQAKTKNISLLIKKHTLQIYASRYFRADQHLPKGHKQELWLFSSDKLWSPLHRSLSSLSHIVIPMCNGILHYMGDRVQQGQPKFTRTIFEPPLEYEVLRDELYCMLLKQMTENPTDLSMLKGWELLLLATSLFSPSSILIKEVEDWLDTRPYELSERCLQRLRVVKFHSRKRSHHWLEVAAAQNQIPILHPVTFPNNMEHIFEVDSFTKVKDLVEKISEWLGLKTSEGFSMIVVYDGAATALSSNEFLFDAILDACNFPATANGHETPKYEYDLMFVKKLWMNTYAGVDETADLVCHYYQELPKYLAGSHNCTANDAMYLGALMFIADIDENSTLLDPAKEILRKLQHLIPDQLVHGLTPHEWMFGIIRAYEQNKAMKSDEAKIMFLKVTQNWPNFGSAFFVVHSSSSMQDEQKTLVVNRNGVCLVCPQTQEIILFRPYAEILGCKFTDFSFSLNTSEHLYVWYSKTSKKIAELVNSYIEAFDSKYLIH